MFIIYSWPSLSILAGESPFWGGADESSSGKSYYTYLDLLHNLENDYNNINFKWLWGIYQVDF